MKKILTFAVLLLMLPFTYARAQSEVWEIITEEGNVLTHVCYEPAEGDEYISGDNQAYIVIKTEGNTAMVRAAGSITLPDVSWLVADEVLPVNATNGRLVAIYCTHSDESYEPSDGTYSDEQRGSIYQIADALADALEEDGAEVKISDALHHPHDAGAYRRSRQTAVQLMKSMPDALFDIHRDGIPDPDAYAIKIGGKECSSIRLLVGRGNQNQAVNKEFALSVKAVADTLYPGLIKDIYMGKGTYNQDLAPKSLLLECGTYTLEKERVMTSMPMMARVLYRTLYGGVTGSAGTSDTRGAAAERNNDITPGATDAPVQENKGVSSGILWIVGIAVLGVIIFGVASTGSISGGMRKAGRSMSEMTGGLIGKKPKDDEEPPHS